MLDIIFYPKNGEPAHYIEVSEDFYEWLAKSQFSKIGKSVSRKVVIDDEEDTIPLVKLGKENRKKLRNFFLEAITEESDAVITKLGDSPSKQEYLDCTYRLKMLQELRKSLENPKYEYLQRF